MLIVWMDDRVIVIYWFVDDDDLTGALHHVWLQ